KRNVLYAFAMVSRDVLLHLRLVVGGLVDGNADLAARAHHGTRAQASGNPMDIEIADLFEVKKPLVEARPYIQAALTNIVCQVVDADETGVVLDGVLQRDEINVVDRTVALALHKVNQAAADAAYRRYLQLMRSHLGVVRLGAALDRTFEYRVCAAHANGK